MVYKGNKPRIIFNPTRKAIVPKQEAKPVPSVKPSASVSRVHVLNAADWHRLKSITASDPVDKARHLQLYRDLVFTLSAWA